MLSASLAVASSPEPSDAAAQETTTVIVTLSDPHSATLDAVAERAELADPATFDSMTSEDSGQVERVFEHLGAFVASVDETQLEALRRDPGVQAIELEELAAPALSSSIPLIGADQLHAIGVDGGVDPADPPVAVAVMDTGVDGDHPAFGARVANGACFARGADGQTGAGDCPNLQSADVGIGAGSPCTFGPSCGHGTHVAGIVASGDEIHRGVAPNVDIVPIQVFSDFGGTPLSWKSDQLAGLDWLIGEIEDGANIAAVNMSLGGGRYTSQSQCDAANPARDQAFRRLAELGVAVIASAGNNGWTDALSAPACVSSALSVGATSLGDAVACYSNSSSDLDFWAPGGAPCTGVPGGIVAPSPGDGFVALSGTSMASPHVAGATALLRQCLVAPDLDAVVDALRYTGVRVDRGAVSAPRIDVLAAAASLVPNDHLSDPAWVQLGHGETLESAGSTRCAAPDADDGASVWFRIDPVDAGLLVASTASGPLTQTTFDTKLTLFKGPADATHIDELTELHTDDNGGPLTSSRLVVPVNGGDHYYLQVGGAQTDRGVFGIRLSLAPTWCLGRLVTHVADTDSLLMLGSASQVVLGTDAPNRVSLGGGDDVMCAGGGDDQVFAGGGADMVFGGPGDDDVRGGADPDRLFGGDGDDQLIGDGGDDELNGNNGADVIRAGVGSDVARGGPGDDQLFGNDGADNLDGNGGDDLLEGQGGDDRLAGHGGSDRLFGGSGADTLRGGSDSDTLFGHDGNDELHGGAGEDVLWGGDGDDLLSAAAGSDVLRGNGGADVLRGGAGADQLWGGADLDDCDGGDDEDPDVARRCETLRRLP